MGGALGKPDPCLLDMNPNLKTTGAPETKGELSSPNNDQNGSWRVKISALPKRSNQEAYAIIRMTITSYEHRYGFSGEKL